MPGMNGTGPQGMGPATGGGRGYCTGFAGRGRGMGMGMGRGRQGGGRGWRNWFHATGLPGWMRFGGGVAPVDAPDPDAEKRMLEGQRNALQAQLDAISQRLAQLNER